MNWLNLNIQTLDSENFLGSDPIDRATWLCLLRYCIGQENSGAIADCKSWADRKWQQLVRVTKKEAERSCDLWEWDGDMLIVWGYPDEKQSEVQRLRGMGKQKTEAKVAASKANGSRGGRPPNNPTENPTENLTETQLKTHGKPIERKGSRKEVEVEIEEEGKESSAVAAPRLMEAWNEFSSLPKIKAWTTARKTSLSARMKDQFFLENWLPAIERASRSPFLTGSNDRGWKADIEFFLQPNSVAKIMEGKYDQSAKQSTFAAQLDSDPDDIPS